MKNFSRNDLEFHLPDPDDEPFLEVALAGGAKAMVTGNKRHFPREEYEGIRMLFPAEFLEALKEKI
jgi:predicted nucleic acid-binding protein